MTAQPDLVTVLREWVQVAEEDIRNADHTLTLQEGCPLRTVCFHAQQCAEKYLKALLTLRAVPFPKTHDLGELLGIMPSDIRVDLTLEEAKELSSYAVETRYPSFLEVPSRDEAERAVATARRVRQATRALLPRDALTG